MPIIGAPVQEYDIEGDSISSYDATFAEGFDASVEGALATNPLKSTVNAITGAFERGRAKQMPSIYTLSPDEANEKYRDLGLKFDGPVSPGYAATLAENKKLELQRAATLERAPKDFWSQAGYFGGGLGASAIDPINVVASFIPVVGPERFASMVASQGVRRARIGKGAIEGAVGSVVVEPLVYAGAQAQQYDYGLADSLMNVAFGTVLGGGLHFTGGEIKDRWLAHKSKTLAETSSLPKAGKIAEMVDNFAPHERADLMRAALGQAAVGQEINVSHLIDDIMPEIRAEVMKSTDAAVDTSTQIARIGEIQNALARTDIDPATRETLTAELGTLRQQVPQAPPLGFNKFVEVARQSANVQDFVERTRTMKGVPKETSEWFKQKYAPEGGDVIQAAERFLKDVKNGGYKPKKVAPATLKKRAPSEPKQELEVADRENTIKRAAELPQEIEQELADLDELLKTEISAGNLTESELLSLESVNELTKKADAAGRGLLAAASCVFRRA